MPTSSREDFVNGLLSVARIAQLHVRFAAHEQTPVPLQPQIGMTLP